MINDGITLPFKGKRTAQVIERKVMPRVIKVNKELSFTTENFKEKNILIDGENLQASLHLQALRYPGTG